MPRKGKSIYKRKDGRWEGRYISGRKENGAARYSYIYGKTEQEVEAKIMERKALVLEENKKELATFSAAALAWIDDRRENISQPSVDRYEYLVGKYLGGAFGELDVNTITPAVINVHLVDLADKQKHGDAAISGTTIDNLRSIATSVVDFATKISYPDLHDMIDVEKRSYEVLSEDEIKKIIYCAKYNRDSVMLGVLFSLYTGIGTGELGALSWDGIDVDKREINIRNTLYRLKNKDGPDVYGKNTHLEVVEVRKSNRRTVRYPDVLDGYVRELYHPGTVFLTGEKDKYLEQRSFANRLEKRLRNYGLKDFTLVKAKKTFQSGLAKVEYLEEAFGPPMVSGFENDLPDALPDLIKRVTVEETVRLDEWWLLKEMSNDLLSLRHILGLETKDMAGMMDLATEEYEAIEAGEADLRWDVFLSLMFLFTYNMKTRMVVDALGLYPKALQQRMALS